MSVVQLEVCSAVYGKVTLACAHRGGAQEARLTDLVSDVGLGQVSLPIPQPTAIALPDLYLLGCPLQLSGQTPGTADGRPVHIQVLTTKHGSVYLMSLLDRPEWQEGKEGSCQPAFPPLRVSLPFL